VLDAAGIPVTESDWLAAQQQTRRSGWLSGLVGLLIVPGLSLASVWASGLVASGALRWVLAAVTMIVLLIPMIVTMLRVTTALQTKSDNLVRTLTGQLNAAVDKADLQAEQRHLQARRQEFEGHLANALDMADGEPEVIDVIERSFAQTLPLSPVELLLADNSHAHLARMASASPTTAVAGCGVDSPDRCPAARRGQVQHFPNSEALDACPKLRGRPAGPLSAVCIPVSIMGRTVGVIHATGEPDVPVEDDAVADMATLAKLAGARVGLLRVMAETQLQASTDSLTGLLNRRSFEQRVAAIRRETPLVSFGMADLDHFKQLNDTYGHETGDRALRLFAQVLSGSVRAQDVVGRHGGEEFVIALVGCAAQSAGDILEGLRSRLDAAIIVAGLPKFTVSVGLVEADPLEELPAMMARADAAMFQAKRAGRDRVVILDANAMLIPPGVTSRTPLDDATNRDELRLEEISALD
jgi:diguanylate cyclase (GGDEF)-like protein